MTWSIVSGTRTGSGDGCMTGLKSRTRTTAFVTPTESVRISPGTRAREAENARLASTVNASSDAIYSVTRERVIGTWNAGAERMYGYAADEIIGQHVSIIIPQERQGEMEGIGEKLLRGESLVHFEFEHRRKDGARLPVLLTLSPIKDASGYVSGVSAISRDITEQKRDQAMLEQYEKVVEGSDDMIAVIDRTYRYLMANRALLRQHSRESGDLIGHSVSEVVGRTFFENVVKKNLDNCFAGNVVHFEINYRYPKLGRRDVFVSYFPIQGSHGIDRAACVMRDITERKRAEEALRNEKAFTDSIIDSLPDVFFILDSDRRFVRWNKNAGKALGYSSEEFAVLDPLSHVVEDERQLAASKFQEALTKGSAAGDFNLLAKDGRNIPSC